MYIAVCCSSLLINTFSLAEQEWKEFTGKLSEAVQQQMNENNVKHFNDLSESEKIFVLEKAAKALHSGDVNHNLCNNTSVFWHTLAPICIYSKRNILMEMRAFI